MLRCQKIPRKHEEGTWISEDILRSYSQLHALGIAHSIEVYTSDNKLVGGLYGISIGAIFYGESMFASQANTSKIAFVFLTKFLSSLGFDLLDCQVTNQHLISLGCTEMSRNQFLKINKKSVSKPTIIGKWTEIAEKFGKDFVI
jgi:leucyl/phenylalanyl-tRNA--protein transferase